MRPPRGVIRLEGLIEGSCPADETVHADLRAWQREARDAGLEFSLELDANRFSLLGAADRGLRAGEGEGAVERRIAAAVGGFMERLPAPYRGRAFSTLRSTRLEDAVRVETVYALDAEGRVRAESRERQDEAGAARLVRDRRAAIVRVVLLLIGAVAVFVVLRTCDRSIRDLVLVPAPAAMELERPREIAVDLAPELVPFVTVESALRDERSLRLVLRYDEDAPRDLGAFVAARDGAEADGALARWLGLEAVFHGRVRVVAVDGEDRVVAVMDVGVPPSHRSRVAEAMVHFGGRRFDLAERLRLEPR